MKSGAIGYSPGEWPHGETDPSGDVPRLYDTAQDAYRDAKYRWPGGGGVTRGYQDQDGNYHRAGVDRVEIE